MKNKYRFGLSKKMAKILQTNHRGLYSDSGEDPHEVLRRAQQAVLDGVISPSVEKSHIANNFFSHDRSLNRIAESYSDNIVAVVKINNLMRSIGKDMICDALDRWAHIPLGPYPAGVEFTGKEESADPSLVDRDLRQAVLSICTYGGSDGKLVLPRGAPSSMMLMHVACRSMDNHMHVAGEHLGMQCQRHGDIYIWRGSGTDSIGREVDIHRDVGWFEKEIEKFGFGGNQYYSVDNR